MYQNRTIAPAPYQSPPKPSKRKRSSPKRRYTTRRITKKRQETEKDLYEEEKDLYEEEKEESEDYIKEEEEIKEHHDFRKILDVKMKRGTCFDTVMNDQISIQKFLRENQSSIVIFDPSGKHPTCFKKKDLEKFSLKTNSNIVYQCLGKNEIDLENKYCKLTLNGIPYYVPYDTLVKLLKDQRKRIYHVNFPDGQDKPIVWKSVMSESARLGEANAYVSGFHCNNIPIDVYEIKHITYRNLALLVPQHGSVTKEEEEEKENVQEEKKDDQVFNDGFQRSLPMLTREEEEDIGQPIPRTYPETINSFFKRTKDWIETDESSWEVVKKASNIHLIPDSSPVILSALYSTYYQKDIWTIFASHQDLITTAQRNAREQDATINLYRFALVYTREVSFVIVRTTHGYEPELLEQFVIEAGYDNAGKFWFVLNKHQCVDLHMLMINRIQYYGREYNVDVNGEIILRGRDLLQPGFDTLIRDTTRILYMLPVIRVDVIGAIQSFGFISLINDTFQKIKIYSDIYTPTMILDIGKRLLETDDTEYQAKILFSRSSQPNVITINYVYDNGSGTAHLWTSSISCRIYSETQNSGLRFTFIDGSSTHPEVSSPNLVALLWDIIRELRLKAITDFGLRYAVL